MFKIYQAPQRLMELLFGPGEKKIPPVGHFTRMDKVARQELLGSLESRRIPRSPQGDPPAFTAPMSLTRIHTFSRWERRRRPFAIAAIAAPSSATSAIHSVERPRRPSTRNTNFKPSARAMYSPTTLGEANPRARGIAGDPECPPQPHTCLLLVHRRAGGLNAFEIDSGFCRRFRRHVPSTNACADTQMWEDAELRGERQAGLTPVSASALSSRSTS